MRGGSPRLNHPERVSRSRTHLQPLVIKWFGLVEPRLDRVWLSVPAVKPGRTLHCSYARSFCSSLVCLSSLSLWCLPFVQLCIPQCQVCVSNQTKVWRVLSQEFGEVRLYRTSLATSLLGQGVQGAYALVRCGSSTANLLEPARTTSLHSYWY